MEAVVARCPRWPHPLQWRRGRLAINFRNPTHKSQFHNRTRRRVVPSLLGSPDLHLSPPPRPTLPRGLPRTSTTAVCLSSPDFLRRRVLLIPHISTSPPTSRSGLFPFLGRFVAGVDRRRASSPSISTGLGFVGRASDPIRVINLRGLDGIQGPVYVGTGCVFNRTALYGYEPPVKQKKKGGFLSSLCGGRKKTSKSKKKSSDKKKSNKHVDSSVPVFNLEDIEEGVEGAGFDDEKSLLMSQISLEKRFGQSAAFVASTLMEYGGVPQSATPKSLLKEAIHVISCGYEDKSEWGTEIGWIYGSVTEDILTRFKMHARGWRSIYCMPKRPAFKGSAPINRSDRLNQVLRTLIQRKN